MANFCRQCGNPLSSGVKFCTECGTPTEQAVPVRQATPIEEPAQMQAVPMAAPMQQSSSSLGGGAAKWVAVGLVAVLAGGGWYYWQEKEAASSKVELPAVVAPMPDAVVPTPTETKPPSSASRKTQPQQPKNESMASDVGLGGICIGHNKNDVYSLLGKEQKITDPNKNGHLHYFYPDIEVVISNNIVTGFISNSAKVSTKRGIHEGSTLQEVLRAYGDNTSKFTYEDSTMYEYSFKSMDRKDCLLRFAIKNNRVDYISARVADGK